MKNTIFKKMRLITITCIALLSMVVGIQAGENASLELPATEKHSVGPDGSFNYTIDIEIPQGRRGLQPKPELVYNSSTQNGIMGVGWSLNGLPVITRDASFPINYDGNDHFVGSGGRLVQTADLTYHFENENFSKIEKSGTQGDGPSYWIETQPDGTKFYYGNTTDSQSLAVDKIYSGNNGKCVRVWALSKVRDVFGNYYTVSYVSDAGEIYPSHIDYTLGAGISKNSSIDFGYDTIRTDFSKSYTYLTSVETKKRLNTITVNNNSSMISKYSLIYNDPIEKISRLMRIEKYNSNNVLADSKSFTWDNTSGSSFIVANYLNTSRGNHELIGDYNGDGKNDLLLYVDGKWKVFLYKNGQLDTGVIWSNSGDCSTAYSGDFNGDSKTDFCYYNGSTWQVLISIGYSFNAPVSWATGNGDQPKAFGDFNGDGKTDILSYKAGTGWQVLLSNGSAFTATTWSTSGWLNNNYNFPLVGDFNGDGKSDFAFYRETGNDGFYVFMSTGNGFVLSPAPWTKASFLDITTIGDFNGDGKSDILQCYPANGWRVFTSTGTTFTMNYWSTASTGSGTIVGDFNADGKSDFTYYFNNSVGWRMMISQGSIFNQPESWTTSGNYAAWPGDFNGDGKTDLLQFVDGAGWRILTNTGEFSGKIVKITNSLKSEIQIAYSQSTQVPGAIDSTQSAYPAITNSSPRNLVSAVTITDGRTNGGSYTTTYDYSNGKTLSGKPYERKDLGFEKVTEIAPDGQKVVTYYNQTKDLAGTPKEVRKLASNGKLMGKQFFNYETASSIFASSDPLMSIKWIKLASQKTENYEMADPASTTPVNSITTALEYNDYGNITKTTTTPSDAATSVNEISYYAIDTANWFLKRPFELKTKSGLVLYSWKKMTYLGGAVQTSSLWNDEKNQWNDTSYEYDTYGNIKKIIDENVHAKEIVYDPNYKTYPTQTINSLGQVQTISYDFNTGKVLTASDFNGNVTSYEYDSVGRLVKEIAPGDDWTKEYTYVNFGEPNTQYKLIKAKDDSTAGYSYEKNYFDGLGRVYKIIAKAEQSDTNESMEYVTEILFDAAGKIASQTKPYIEGKMQTYATVYEYDAAGRMKKEMIPGNKTKSYAYGINGSKRTVKVTDVLGNETTSYINSQELVVSKNEPENGNICYEYDILKRLVKVTDSKSKEMVIKYNMLGNKTEMTDPNAGHLTYMHDVSGRITMETDAKGQTRNYTYDALNRILQEVTSGRTITYSYDNASVGGIGKLTSVSDGTVTTTYAYNEKGNNTVWTQSIDGKNFAFKNTFNAQNKITSITYPDGKIVNNVYSDTGFLNKVKLDNKIVAQYGWNENESTAFKTQIVRLVGNGIKTIINYDPETELPSTLVTLKDDAELENVTYGYDAKFNITSISDSKNAAFNETYAYDGMNRLVNATGAYGSKTYTFDTNGNLTKKGSATLAYEDVAHPHAVTSTSSGKSYGYDANGNMTSRDGKALKYDSYNQLTSVWTGATKLEEYTYDHTGMRIKVWKSDGSIQYTIGGLYSLWTDGGSVERHTKYIKGIKGELVAQVTEPGSQLSAYNYFNIIKDGYTVTTISGLILKGYYTASAWIVSKNAIRHIGYGLMGIAALFTFYLLIMSFSKWNKLIPVQLRATGRFAALLVGITLFTFGFNGCDLINFGDTMYGDGANPSLSGKPTIDGTASSESGLAVDGVFYFHPNHLGSTKMVTNGAGNVVSTVVYDPYGEIVRDQSSGADIFKQKYTGQSEDRSTGLMYYGARFYDPEIGRFITPDSVIPDTSFSQAFNRYMYVVGNPIGYNDPSGHSFVGWVKDHSKKFADYMTPRRVYGVFLIIVAVVILVVFVGLTLNPYTIGPALAASPYWSALAFSLFESGVMSIKNDEYYLGGRITRKS